MLFTVALTFVNPAPLIAPAITSASVVAAVAVNVIVTGDDIVALPVIDSLIVKSCDAAVYVLAVIAALVILVAPVACLTISCTEPRGRVSSATFVLAYTAPATILAPPPVVSIDAIAA